jgi:uncharacterized protein
MTKTEEAPLVVAFVDDLMFTTRIQNVVRGLDYRVRWVGKASEIEGKANAELEAPGEQLSGKAGRLFELITSWQPALLLFDLANSAVPWERWMAMLKSSPATRRIPIIAFGPHTNVEMMQKARSLGAEAVLARSRFTDDMPAILQNHIRVQDSEAILAACKEDLAPLARSGIEKFNRGEYYAGHDDLEEAWRQDDGAARDLYRGILQVGIAYYQIDRGNYRGAAKMLLRVRQWLDPLPDICRGVNVEQLRKDATATYEELVALGPDQINLFDRGLFRPVRLVDE